MLLPAQSLKEYMVTFSAMLDSSKQAERRVSSQVVIKLDVIQILDCDPTEDGPRFLNVARASTY